MLPALLRANLHTRQYADLLGRVLKQLAPFPGGIADSDLTFLWDLTQKVGTRMLQCHADYLDFSLVKLSLA